MTTTERVSAFCLALVISIGGAVLLVHWAMTENVLR